MALMALPSPSSKRIKLLQQLGVSLQLPLRISFVLFSSPLATIDKKFISILKSYNTYGQELANDFRDADTQTSLQTLTTSSSSSTAQSFHLFPLLPTELRLQIWNHAISKEPAFLPRGLIPCEALLHTCKDSRTVFLSIYTLCFRPDMHFFTKSIGQSISLYGNLEHDTLFLDPKIVEDPLLFHGRLGDWSTPAATGKKGVQRIVIMAGPWVVLGPTGFIEGSIYFRFRNFRLCRVEGLKKIIFVNNDPHCVDWDDYESPPLGERKLLDCPDQVVDPRCLKLFYGKSDVTPEPDVPDMRVARIVQESIRENGEPGWDFNHRNLVVRRPIYEEDVVSDSGMMDMRFWEVG